MAYNFQTFGNVIDEAYAEASVDSGNSVAGFSQAMMEGWANRFSKIFIEKCRLKTQDDTYSFRTLSDTTLSASAASGATSLALAVSNVTLGYPTSGLILLDGVPYTYSNIVTTTMTVEALDRAYSAGDTVQVGYAVPTNFGKPRSLFVGGGTDMFPTIGDTRYELQKWGTESVIRPRRFSVFNDYIFLPEDITASNDVILHYYKKASNTQTSASTNEIYQMWDGYVIARLVARIHRVLNGGLDNPATREYEQLALEVLSAARSQVAQEDLSINRGFVPGF